MKTSTYRWIVGANVACMLLNLIVFMFVGHNPINIIAAVVSAVVVLWMRSQQEPSRR